MKREMGDSSIIFIIFDIAGVFLDGNINTFLDHVSRLLSISFEGDQHHQCLNEDLNLGNIGILEYIERRTNRSLSKHEAESVRSEWNRTWTINNYLYHLAKELKSNGYIVCLSSNSDNENSEIYEKKNYYEVFDHRFLSHEMKKLKPMDDHFDEICQVLNADPSECVFIDDDEQNVRIANDYGFHALHVDRNLRGRDKAIFLRKALSSMSVNCEAKI